MDFRFTLISRNVIAVEKYFKMYFKAELKKYGFNTTEGLILYILYTQAGVADEYGGKTQEQLCSLLYLDKAEISRTIKCLESKGYLLRSNHPTDSRSSICRLTEKALAFQPQLFEILREWNEDVLSAMDTQTLNLVNASLENILVNAKRKVGTTKA